MSETSYKELRNIVTKRNRLCKLVMLITPVLGEKNFKVYLHQIALLNLTFFMLCQECLLKCQKDTHFMGHVLRTSHDYEPIRKKATLKPKIILANVNAFEGKWKGVAYEERPILNVKALDELRKLQKHVTKKCLSEIPEGCGLERNENLHKWLRSVLLRNRLSVPLALALFTTYFYVWNEKRKHGSNVVIPPVDCSLLDEPTDNPTSESFGIPHNADSPVNVPRVFLEECTQYFCNTEMSETDFSNVAIDAEGTLYPDELTKEELLFVIDQTIILHTQYQSLKDGGLLSVFNPRFLNLMHQQALFAFDTMNCKTANFDDNYSKLDAMISGLGFQILPVPKDGDCLFTSVIFQMEQMAPLSDSNELTAFMERLKSCDTLLEKVLFLRGKLVNEWLSNK